MRIEFDGDNLSTKSARDLLKMSRTDFESLLYVMIRVAIARSFSKVEVLKIVERAGQSVFEWWHKQ